MRKYKKISHELKEVKCDIHDFIRRNREYLSCLLFNLKIFKGRSNIKRGNEEEKERSEDNRQKLGEKKRLKRSKAR